MHTVRRRHLAVLWAGILFAALVSSSAWAAPVNTIQKLWVEETESHTEIHVAGTQTPSLTVFKLEDPIRLFIDMPQTDLSRVDGTLPIRNGVIEHVGTLQFKKGKTPIGRIIVMLTRDALYEVKSEGTNTVIRVDGAGRVQGDVAGGSGAVTRALEEEKNLLQQIKLARLREEQLRTQAQTEREKEEALRQQVAAARAEAEFTHSNKQTQMNALRSEREDLEQALSRRDALVAEIQDMEDQKQTSGKLKNMEKELASARFQASRADQERKAALAESMVREQTLSAELDEARTEQSGLKSRLQEASSSLTTLQQELDQLRANQLDPKRLAELETQTREAETRKATLEIGLSTANSTIDKLEGRLASVEQERAAQIASLQGKLDEAVRKAREKEEALRSEQSSYRTHAEQKLATLQAEVNRLSDAVKAREGKLSADLSDKEKALLALEADYAQQRATNEGLQGEIQAQEAAVSSLRKAYEAEQARLNETTEQRQKEEARVADLKNAAQSLQTEIEQLRSAQTQLETAALNAARDRETALETQVAALNARIRQEQAQGAAENSAVVQKLQAQIEQSRQEARNAEEKANQEKNIALSAMETQLQSLQTALDQASNRSAERKAEIDRLNGLLQDAVAREKAREAELEQLGKAIRSTKKSRDGKNEELVALRDQLQESLKRDAERKATLEEFKSELQSATRREEARKGQIDSLTAKLEANAQKAAVRDAELAALREELKRSANETRRKELEATEKALVSARNQDLELNNQLKNLRSQLQNSARREQERESQIQELTQKLSAAAEREAQRDTELSQLRSQIADSRGKEALQELADTRARLEEVGTRESEQSRELQALKDQLQRASDRDSSRQTELEQLRKKLVAATDAETQKEQKIVALSKGLDDARKRAEDRKALIRTLESNLKKAEARDEARQQELENLRGQMVNAKDEAEVARLRTELKQLQTRDVAREQALLALDAELADTRARERDRSVNLQKLETDLKLASLREGENQQEVQRLKNRLKEVASADKKAIQAELKNLRKEAKDASKESERLRQLVSKMQKTSEQENAAAAQLTSLRNDLKSAINREKSREDEVTALRAQMATLTAERDSRIAKLQARVTELEGHLEGSVAQASAAPTSSISDVRFRDYANVSRIEMNFSGDSKYEILEQREDKAVLLVRNAHLPDSLQRSLDTSEFGSPVSLVSSYRSNIPGETGDVRLVVNLRGATPNRVVRVKEGLVWEFERQQNASYQMGKPHSPAGVKPERKNPQPAADPARLQYYPNMVGQATAGNAQGAQNPYFSRRKKKKKYNGKRINLTIKDADIQHVLTFLAKEGGVNIVAGDEVSGNVSFHLENIPWDLALDMILKAKGFDYVKEQGVYRVALAETITKEVELELEKKKKLRDLRQLVVRLIPVNYADGKEMSGQVEKILSERGSVTVDERTNTLIVKDTEDYIIAAEDLVRRLDTQTPQVLIEARIVEASSSFVRDVGIQWGGDFAMSPVFGNETGLAFPSIVGVSGGASGENSVTDGLFTNSPGFAVNLPAPAGEGAGGALGLTLGSLSGAANLNLRLSAQEQEGNVKIISSPRISTLDNRTAIIRQGVSIPISVVSSQGVNTQFFNADLQLEVTPHVTQDGNIAMDMNISKNEPNFGQTGANGTPTIQKKEASTELLLRDGDTTVIGGIYTRNSGENYSKVPVLGDIPILGWLFKTNSVSDQRSELLIFITPRIINRPAALQAASE